MNTENPYHRKAIGSLVRTMRHSRGLTQERLGERCDLAADTVRRFEHGDFTPSLETLRKLAYGLGLRLSTFFSSWRVTTRRLNASSSSWSDGGHAASSTSP